MNNNRIATEKQKLIQEKCLAILTTMLKDEDNKYCVDCDAKGPRWASWNLGVFLCIRCAGIHRNLGVHISKVKSVNLDTWKPEQAVALQQMGNSRARAVYEANLPDNFRRPQTDSSLESFIRAKYEHNKYTAREWVPPKPPKVNWDAEIDALQRENRKGGSRGRVEQPAVPVLQKPLPSPVGSTKPAPAAPPPPVLAAAAVAKDPPPPQQQQSVAVPAVSTAAADLLALETPAPVGNGGSSDVFGDFLSAAPAAEPASGTTVPATQPVTSAADPLAADEASFFSQPADAAAGGGAKVMSKDSILALFGQSKPAVSAPLPGLSGLNMSSASVSGPGFLAQSQMSGAFQQQQQQHQTPGGYPQQHISGGFPQQQQHMPGAFPQQQHQQIPGAFPQQQHQQMPAAFPQQHQQMPAAFPQQQQHQQIPGAFPQQQQHQQMPGAFPQQQMPGSFSHHQQQLSGGFAAQQGSGSFQPLSAGLAQQPQSMPAAFGGQAAGPSYSQASGLVGQQQQGFSLGFPTQSQQTPPQYQPASFQQPLHQQMSGLGLGEQSARVAAGAPAFPAMGGLQQVNGQRWQ